MADSRFATEVVSEVNSILGTEAGDLSKWKQIVAVLLKTKIAYLRKGVSHTEIMVHPMNRMGLGLNAHEAHKVLAHAIRVGVDAKLLLRATAFEMPTAGPAQTSVVKFNENLVERSGGLLAPLSGEERLLSVSCSHWTAACRACEHGCVTPEGLLQDTHGRINKLQLTQDDPEFARIMRDGFDELLVIPAYAEFLWPELPNLAQSALNAEQSSYTMASEVQVMVSMAHFSATLGDWASVIAKVRELSNIVVPAVALVA